MPARACPTVTLAVEHYNRMVRVLDKGVPVKVELNVETKFYDEQTPNGFNTIAEIPGSDLAAEGESCCSARTSTRIRSRTGATDNATGSAAMMEAMRILKAVGAKPRRTIRVALWGGGRAGAARRRAPTCASTSPTSTTMAVKPEHAKLRRPTSTPTTAPASVRGHLAAEQPGGRGRSSSSGWRRCGTSACRRSARARSPRPITSSFDAVGVPAFQFMVDRLEYNSRTHHSNMDTFDRVQRDDMVQQATVVAVFAYNAAMRDEKLPRKALPAPRRGRATTPNPQ